MALVDMLLSGKVVAIGAFSLRLILLCWGTIQDTLLDVKFTDVDYYVFTDAARFVANGDSPFKRATYRYSPLISFILLPNILFWENFGKIVFSACDLLAGWLIYQIMAPENAESKTSTFRTNNSAVVAACLWLFNPLVATVSVRGNAESVMSCLVLLVLYLLIKERVLLAAIFHGLSVHLKIYPVMYSVTIMMYLTRPALQHRNSWKNTLYFLLSPNYKKLVFAATSMLTFFGVTAAFYTVYGQEYIQESFLYHFIRRDTRHNFSVYFYVFYLLERTAYSKLLGILAFLPQAVLVLAAGLTLHQDLPLSWFVQTVIFVTFNKICTSQYFLWYLTLLPLVVPHVKMSLWRAAILTGAWFGTQGLWLGSAYLVEFQSYNAFLAVWAASVIFFVTNVYVLVDIVKHYQTPSKHHSVKHQ